MFETERYGIRHSTTTGLLGDTPARDYSRKLRLFNACAEPELRALIASLSLQPRMRVLDAGCGTGEALAWLSEAVAPDGMVVGIELAAAHAAAAQTRLRAAGHPEWLPTEGASAQLSPMCTAVVQADLLGAPLADASFDLIWSINTINHLPDPLAGIRGLTRLLRSGGRIALGQSSFLPDMYFSWDARLERLTNEAVREYYRHRYGVTEHKLASVRSVVGLLRAAGLTDVRAHSILIERISPLRPADEGYLLEAIFRDSWGERLRPYLSADDFAELSELCDPSHPRFALRRPDFHFLQTFTLVVAQ